MAITIGRVLSLAWSGAVVCARIGQPGAAEQLILPFDTGRLPRRLLRPSDAWSS